MAVLEKIRKRSVLLFVIIIGALLAFILGDFFNSGRTWFGNRDTLAKAGNTSVKQQDYSDAIELVENQYKDTPVDADFKQHEALHQAMIKKLLEKEFERLGIVVDEDFISAYVNDANNSFDIQNKLLSGFGPQRTEIMNYLGNPQTPDAFVKAYYQAMNRSEKEDPNASMLLANWQNMESNLDMELKNKLFGQVMSALMVPNKADAKALNEDDFKTANLTYAKVDLSTVKDKDVKLTDADYQAVYNQVKGKYQIKEENREVAYILIDIVPSAKDYEKAASETRKLIADLGKNSDATKVLSTNKSFKLGASPSLTLSQIIEDNNYNKLVIVNDKFVIIIVLSYLISNNRGQ